MITNNIDFYQYMTNRGVPCVYMVNAPNYHVTDEIAVIFTNNYHSLAICGNAHQDKYKDDYQREASELVDWFETCNKVICISNIIKFNTPYMQRFEDLWARCSKLDILTQNVHTKDIGELINPHRIQIRYKGLAPIKFDIAKHDNIRDPKYHWLVNGNVFMSKSQQMHYINCINATHDRDTRRKLRYIPEYTLYSQLYKKLPL